MRTVGLLLTFMALLWGGQYRVNTPESNAYYRAETSLLLVGSDEIVGVNPALEGWIADTYDGGELTLDAARFDSDNGTRDGHIREILEAEAYPQIRFTVTSLEGIDDAASGAGTLNGKLEVKTAMKTVTLPVRWKRENGTLVLQGKTSVDYSDFNITPPSLGWGIVKQAVDRVEIGARVVLRLQEGE